MFRSPLLNTNRFLSRIQARPKEGRITDQIILSGDAIAIINPIRSEWVWILRVQKKIVRKLPKRTRGNCSKNCHVLPRKKKHISLKNNASKIIFLLKWSCFRTFVTFQGSSGEVVCDSVPKHSMYRYTYLYTYIYIYIYIY